MNEWMNKISTSNTLYNVCINMYINKKEHWDQPMFFYILVKKKDKMSKWIIKIQKYLYKKKCRGSYKSGVDFVRLTLNKGKRKRNMYSNIKATHENDILFLGNLIQPLNPSNKLLNPNYIINKVTYWIYEIY